MLNVVEERGIEEMVGMSKEKSDINQAQFRAFNLIEREYEYWNLRGLAEDKDIEWHHYEYWSRYIGEKDKNNRMIFEGDTIESDSGERQRVVFENGKWTGDEYHMEPIFNFWKVIKMAGEK